MRRLHPGSRWRSGRRSRTASTTTSSSRADPRGRPRGHRNGGCPRAVRGAQLGEVEVGRDEARTRFETEGELAKVELVDTADGDISLYTQGDFTDLCRGPHLQDSRPIKAFKLDWPGRGLLARRREEQPAHPDLRDGFTQADLDALEQARLRTTIRGIGTQLDLFHFDEHSPGSPFWHPKGMALFNVLEDLRRSENTRRGDEVRTPIIYDKSLWETSGHWEKFRENMFQIPVDEQQLYALKPMNCPGYMLLFRSRLAATPLRPVRRGGAPTATSPPAPCTG